MKQLKTTLTAILVCVTGVTSQAQLLKMFPANRTLSITEQYTDSLKAVQLRLAGETFDSTPTLKSSYAPLFLPPTFYKGVSRRAFTFDAVDTTARTTLIDHALLNIYLSRPDLVKNTESRLEAVGPVREVHKAIKPTVRQLPVNTISETVVPTPQPDDYGIKIYKPRFWSYAGDYYLQFIQNFVSGNWYKGGESNYSMVGAVTMQANYNNKQKVKWDNKLEMKLGLQTSRSDDLHKLKTSEDLLRYTGKLGFQATKKWYYTVQLIVNTQFMRGYKNNDPLVYSDFLSPVNTNLSVGMDYNVSWFDKRLTGTIHLAPAAYNFRYVGRLALSKRYGLGEGEHTLHDLGSECTLDLAWNFSEMIRWKTRLYGYTTYRRGEIEWENTLVFRFNRYISSNIFIYPRFDDGVSPDDHYGYWQIKEYASLGFSYSF